MTAPSTTWVLVLSAIAMGCSGPPPKPPPVIPVVPLSFETNLVTSRDCQYRGISESDSEAQRIGANLVVAFVYSRSEYKENGRVIWTFSSMKGKAVKCPPAIVEQLVRRDPLRAER